MLKQILIHSRELFLVRGLESILRETRDFQLRHCYGAAAELCAAIGAIGPDVLLIHFSGPVDLSLVKEVKESSDVRIVLWVQRITPETALQAIGLGVLGILRDTVAPHRQIECLQTVHRGELWVEAAVLDGCDVPHNHPLTRREGQILSLISQGLRNKEIATHLTLSEGTVKAYLTKLFQKIGARDRLELAIFGLKEIAGSTDLANSSASRTLERTPCPAV